MSADKKVLVYQYQAGKNLVLKTNPEVITPEQLTEIARKHTNLQQSSKPIKRTDITVKIEQHDLLTQAEKSSSTFNSKPNYDANVASVNIPKDVIAKNIVSGAYHELIILSIKRND